MVLGLPEGVAEQEAIIASLKEDGLSVTEVTEVEA